MARFVVQDRVAHTPSRGAGLDVRELEDADRARRIPAVLVMIHLVDRQDDERGTVDADICTARAADAVVDDAVLSLSGGRPSRDPILGSVSLVPKRGESKPVGRTISQIKLTVGLCAFILRVNQTSACRRERAVEFPSVRLPRP